MYAIGQTGRSASDAPIWARALHWSAVLIGFALVGVLVLAWRVGRFVFGHRRHHTGATSLWRWLRRGAHTQHTHANSAVGAALGAFLGARLGAHQQGLIQLWRIDTPGGAYAVRVPIPPAHPFDVRVGDNVRCSGRLQRDSTLHAHRVFDQRTGEGIRIQVVRLEAVAIVAIAALFGILLLTRL